MLALPLQMAVQKVTSNSDNVNVNDDVGMERESIEHIKQQRLVFLRRLSGGRDTWMSKTGVGDADGAGNR